MILYLVVLDPLSLLFGGNAYMGLVQFLIELEDPCEFMDSCGLWNNCWLHYVPITCLNFISRSVDDPVTIGYLFLWLGVNLFVVLHYFGVLKMSVLFSLTAS